MQIAKIKPTNYVYNKKQMLGKGSFGEVFLGFNQKEKFPVAVKVVSFERIAPIMNKETLMTKLKQEIVNMQIAKNQNLVQLLDAQVSSRNLYIICEYCNGESFDVFLKRKGYLTEPEALKFFKQILKGFQNLHNKKIVHRDLKPANLLLHNFNIKIADLGFSKAIDQHEQLLQSIVGTPLYMSPQIFNRQKYTQKTDIWSLGVILYEMLYGRIPWKAKSLMQLKQKVQKHPVQFPQQPIVTVKTKQLIQNMLQLQQQKRVGWQQLFKGYISNPFQTLTMMDQQKQSWQISYTKLFNYINSSFYIESQNQLLKILTELNILTSKQIENENKFEKAEDLFTSMMFIFQNKLKILSYCFYFFGRRNRICYFMKIFEELSYIIKQIQSNKNTQISNHISLSTAQLLIIKFAIHSLHKVLNRQIDTEQQKQMAKIIQSGPNPFPKYINILFRHDFQTFGQFYNIFFEEVFMKKLKYLEINNPQLLTEVNKQVGGLYANQIGDYKFVKFMLINCLRSVFNELKNMQPKSPSIFMVTRMIFEFQKDKKIFELGDLLESFKTQKSLNNIKITNSHDLNKKLNQWTYDIRWASKLIQLPDFNIESLNSFINKQFRWNPLHIYALDILK